MPFSAAAIGNIFTAEAIPAWYQTLDKPAFSPPDYLFGPVWTLLYLLMGISLYLVWTNKGKKEQFIPFSIQLALNASWSIIFFGLKMPELALMNILALEAAIIWTSIAFYKKNKLAAYLFIPYILWVAYATALNLGIVLLN